MSGCPVLSRTVRSPASASCVEFEIGCRVVSSIGVDEYPSKVFAGFDVEGCEGIGAGVWAAKATRRGAVERGRRGEGGGV